MSTEYNQTGGAPDSTHKIEAIKNLIFGENMEQIDKEFEVLRKTIDQKKADVDQYIAQTRSEIYTAINNLINDINAKLKDLETNTGKLTDALEQKKMDKYKLGGLLVELGEKIMKE